MQSSEKLVSTEKNLGKSKNLKNSRSSNYVLVTWDIKQILGDSRIKQ